MPFQKKPTNYNDEHKERFVFLLSFGTFDLFGCFTGHLVVHLLIFIGYETILCHNASCNLSQTFIAAITTVVTIAEILKKNGLAIEKSKNLHLLILKSFPSLMSVNNLIPIVYGTKQKFWHLQLARRTITKGVLSKRPR